MGVVRVMLGRGPRPVDGRGLVRGGATDGAFLRRTAGGRLPSPHGGCLHSAVEAPRGVPPEGFGGSCDRSSSPPFDRRSGRVAARRAAAGVVRGRTRGGGDA